MKKIISFMLSIVMTIALIPKMSISVSAAGYNPQTVVNLALSKVGTDYMNGYCLAFVRQMFESAYGFSSTACCAYKYGSRYIDSTSRTNIPLGADVFFGGSSKTCSTCGNKCGHIGIYVGDDYVVHGWNGKIEKFKIDRIINAGYPYRGWGWHYDMVLGDVSTNPDDYTFPNRDIYYKSSGVMKGSDVGWIQAVLYQLGYDITIDCSFGPASKTVVEKFQRDNGLSVDGSVGPVTREKLRQKWEDKKKSNVTLSSISVATYPNKTSYSIGEALDTTGLTLTATYSNGQKKTVTEDYSVSGFDSSTAGTKTLTVSFDGKTTTFTVTVKEAKTYTIAYNANGGTGTMANTVMTVGTAKNLTANAFTRTGYGFLGWSTDKTASTAAYKDKELVNNLAESGTVTLYAVWKKDSAPSTNTAVIRIDDTTAKPGQSVQIPVYIDNAELVDLVFAVTYDPKVLKYASSSDMAFGLADINTNNAANGQVIMSCVNNSGTVTGKFVVITFEVLAESDCTTKITASASDATDSQEKTVVLADSEATVSVISKATGDVNGDGKVTVADARWVLQAASGSRTLTAEQKSAADVNGDGKVTVADARWLLQIASGSRKL